MSGSQHLLLGAVPQVVSDPNFEYTTLLLPGNGTNGAQNNTFLDSSTNAFSITRNGNTTQGTFSPFSQTGWGVYFSGTDDYLSLASNSAFVFGTGDFTMEAWVFVSSFTAASTIFFGTADANEANCCVVGVNSSKKLRIQNTSTAFITDTVDFPLAQWVHVVAVRSGTTLSLYKNGTRVGTATNSTSFTSNSGPRIGGDTAIADLDGYLSNVRFVKGTAVYDPSQTTLTVPTAPLTAISGTSLLTCQSNRFVDNSGNAFAITRNGDVSVQAFSPFNPTAAWSAATNGGSGYFDGSGDFLACPDNAALEPGSSDLTWEMWINTTSTTQYATLYSRTTASFSSGMWSLMINFASGTAGDVALFVGDYSTSGGLLYANTVNVRDGAWHHIAVVRSGSAWTLYVDGVSRSTGTFAGAIADIAGGPYIGRDQFYGRDFSGYISGLRIVKGTAVYTAGFTPPTAPPTAITNTSLLLNYTNAGIYDATSKNDLETVGNAQISTTQSKFGGSSMYFDGTGDRLDTRNIDLLTLGAGDFTVEMWFRANSTSPSWQGLIDWRPSDTSTYPGLVINSNTIKWAKFGGAMITSGNISANTWYHLAICRSGSSTKMFLDGTQTGSTYTDTNNYISNSVVKVGSTFANEDFGGYINDLRITKGIARYTSNFTPPTTAFLTL